MALAGAGKLEATSNLLSEMIAVFEADDAGVITEIHKKQGDCVKICEKRQAEAKRVVRGVLRAFHTVNVCRDASEGDR